MIAIKDFSKELTKLKKSDLAYEILNAQYHVVKDYVENVHKKKFEDTFKKLYQHMYTVKAAKGFKAYLKETDKSEYEIGWAVIISDMFSAILNDSEKIEMSEEDVEEIHTIYTEVLSKLLKRRIKEIKSDVPEEVLQELLVVAPSADYISDEKFTGIYSRKMVQKLYALTKKSSPEDIGLNSAKAVRKLFKEIFGKELLVRVALEILLERKDAAPKSPKTEVQMYSFLTEFALQTLEDLDKDGRKAALEMYCKRRFEDNKRERDSVRRVDLKKISSEEYPKLCKMISKLSSDNNIAKWL